jgi:hypothetical protein
MEDLKKRMNVVLAENQRLNTEILFPKQGIGMQSMRRLMAAADQKPGDFATALLYRELIREEYSELDAAWVALLRFREGDTVVNKHGKTMTLDELKIDLLDACADLIVTVQGLAEGMNFDLVGGYNEVMRSNLTKIAPDGKVHKNELGKITKPEGYVKPALGAYL